MSNPYVQKEVNKIINESEIEFPKNHALATAWIIANFKGINIKIFDAQGASSLCDYNIIATAENTIQAKSMVDEITYNLKQNEANVISIEGMREADWILLDFGDIIVHIFQENSRDLYDLDQLWSHYAQIDIPQEYYFSSPDVMNEKSKTNSTDNYF